MTKVFTLLCLFLCFSITAADKKNITKANKKSDSLNIYTNLKDEANIYKDCYMNDNPDEKVKVLDEHIDTIFDNYDLALKKIATDKEIPDIIIVDYSFYLKFQKDIDSYFMDLTDLYQSVKDEIIQYPAEFTLQDGKIYGIGLFANTGAFFYRRSLAKKYLGTDNPASVQKVMCNWGQFVKTAEKLNKKSNGKCSIVTSWESMLVPFLVQRKNNWIENGRVVIDPVMNEYLDLSKKCHDEGYEAGYLQWSPEWFNAYTDVYDDKETYQNEVFGYFLPDWGYEYLIKLQSPQTSGDWGIIQGPAPYFWGNTLIMINKRCKDPEQAKKFVKYMLTDEKSNFLLSASNKQMHVNKKIMNKIYADYKDEFLGGQNPYKEYLKYAENVISKPAQQHDDRIKSSVQFVTRQYVLGSYTRQEAINELGYEILDVTGISD